MNESLDLQSLWNQDAPPEVIINATQLQQGIRQSLKKQRRQLSEYYWSSFVYQLIIYALAAHVVVRYWGDMKLMLMSLALLLLYVPFTWIQRRRYLDLCTGDQRSANLLASSIKDYVNNQLHKLEAFYRFKKWYERLVLPVNIALMVAVVFEVFVAGGVLAHWLAALVVFLVFGSMFAVALLKENLKRFREPIRAYKKLLNEMEDLGPGT